jgi:hypothetical protein
VHVFDQLETERVKVILKDKSSILEVGRLPGWFFPWRLDQGQFGPVLLIRSQVHLLLHQVGESQGS